MARRPAPASRPATAPDPDRIFSFRMSTNYGDEKFLGKQPIINHATPKWGEEASSKVKRWLDVRAAAPNGMASRGRRSRREQQVDAGGTPGRPPSRMMLKQRANKSDTHCLKFSLRPTYRYTGQGDDPQVPQKNRSTKMSRDIRGSKAPLSAGLPHRAEGLYKDPRPSPYSASPSFALYQRDRFQPKDAEKERPSSVLMDSTPVRLSLQPTCDAVML